MRAAIIGKNYTLTVNFTNEDSTPFCVSKPVQYKVFAFDNTFIIEGAAIQNQIDPSQWIANFVIPEGAPIPTDVNNQQYYIDWYAENTSSGLTNQMKAKQYFQVLSQAEPNSYDSAICVTTGQPVRDCLMTDLPILECDISIRNMEDTEFWSAKVENPDCIFRNNCYVTNFDSGTAITGVTDQNMGICPYLVVYTYKTEQGYNTEVHTLYIVSGKAMMIVNNMRRYLDKARNFDIDPSLRWTDAELIHFVTVGLNRFNVALPNITNYTISSFPGNYIYVIEKCAEHEALNALYLAEGMRAFEFTGASVTLNVDRTQYIQTKMDEIGNWLNENLTKIKTLLIRKVSGNAAMSMQFTSVTNGFGRKVRGDALNALLGRRYW